MKSVLVAAMAVAAMVFSNVANADDQPYRPPAVPLVVHNPFLSIWSCADKLTDENTRHWTHKPESIDSLIRIDSQSFRLMGGEPAATPPLPQVSVKVLPTRTIYEFEGSGVHLTLTFVTPMLPTDVEVLSRPLTYINWDVKSTDGKPHAVSVLFGATGQLAVNKPDQKVGWQRAEVPSFTALKMGNAEQPYVQNQGDQIQIDWGYAYIAAPAGQATGAFGSEKDVLQSFADTGKLPGTDDANQPREIKTDLPAMALDIDFGQVANDVVNRRAMIAYDDVFAVDFFGKKTPGIWRDKPGMNGEQLLVQGDQQYASLLARCIKFDDELMADLTKVGGKDYAYMCALAYRQSIGGCGVVNDSHGQPMLFTKENSSNGNMATVDVIFPMDPILLLLSPTLAKASIAPVLTYSASPRWKWPNAPHDLGEYPVAFGRDEGGEAMPVEESGNMVILADAICQIDGNTKFVDAWWPQLTQWAKFLEQYGFDPANQLCTDDFKGTLAHNANLSVKAIVALAAYGDMCRIKGEGATATRYMEMAKSDAKHWIEADSEGDHFKLAFDKPNTWGQNYNMVWDQILGLNVFPAEVKKKQIEFFKTKMKPYGLPLDNRNTLAKSDWSMWTASMADNQADYEAIINPMVGYLNTTNDRTPFTDGYWTDSNKKKDFFHARPVIGGVFIRMLTDKAVWKKWTDMDKEVVGTYAKLPPMPVVTEVVPTSRKMKITWAYTTEKPAEGWTAPEFSSSTWQKGLGGFGHGAPHTSPRSEWQTDDIYLRREFELPAVDTADLKFMCYHDDDVEIYINGVLAAKATGYVANYEPMEMNEAGRAALKPGKNLLAVHCHQIKGGQYIDVGLATVKMPRE